MKIPDKIAIKIRYGYGSMDFVVVNSMEDVARAIYARAEKIPVMLGGRMISGQEIKEISPDVHSYTGWYRSYTPTTSEDFAQIERDVPEVIGELITLTSKRVEAILASSDGTPRLAGQFEPAKLLENPEK